MNDEHVIYYNWLADSTTILHICNMYNAFITYEPIEPIPAIGVSNIRAHMKGCGSIQIKSHCNNHKYTLILENVLHVPENSNTVT